MPASTGRLRSFDDNAGRARELVGLGESLRDITVGRVDAADIYRAALVQAVAAVDAYVHGMVLDLGVNILLGHRETGGSAGIGLDFHAVSRLMGIDDPAQRYVHAASLLNARLSRETYQRPDDISAAFAMVGVRRLWSAAFGAEAGERKTALGLIVTRRNQIVHECDADRTEAGVLQSLTASDSVAAISTIHDIVHSIDRIARRAGSTC